MHGFVGARYYDCTIQQRGSLPEVKKGRIRFSASDADMAHQIVLKMIPKTAEYALRTVAEGIERLRSPERSMLIITHYPRLLEYVRPDRVHVLRDGRITRSGGPELARELEKEGYGPNPAGEAVRS